MSESHHGSCLCGELQFTAHAAPQTVGMCHCRMCARHTGAPFVVLAKYPDTDVTFEGESYGYESSKGVDRRGCAKCGAPVYIVVADGDYVEVYLGAYDEPAAFAPQYEIFDINRPGWLPHLDGVPTYPGFKDK